MFTTAFSTPPNTLSALAAERPTGVALGFLIAVDLPRAALLVLSILVLLLLSVLAT